MSLLDFIKNRQSHQQSSAPQAQPETAKQMYTREAGQEKSGQKPISLSPEGAASAKEAGDLFRRGTQPNTEDRSAPTPSTQDSATSPQPMAQLSMHQDKAAPALSPTSAQQGIRSIEQEMGSSPTQDSGKSQEQAKRTMARTTPSWER